MFYHLIKVQTDASKGGDCLCIKGRVYFALLQQGCVKHCWSVWRIREYFWWRATVTVLFFTIQINWNLSYIFFFFFTVVWVKIFNYCGFLHWHFYNRLSQCGSFCNTLLQHATTHAMQETPRSKRNAVLKFPFKIPLNIPRSVNELLIIQVVGWSWYSALSNKKMGI